MRVSQPALNWEWVCECVVVVVVVVVVSLSNEVRLLQSWSMDGEILEVGGNLPVDVVNGVIE